METLPSRKGCSLGRLGGSHTDLPRGQCGPSSLPSSSTPVTSGFRLCLHGWLWASDPEPGLAGLSQLLALERYDGRRPYPFLATEDLGASRKVQRVWEMEGIPTPGGGCDNKGPTSSLPYWVLRPVPTRTSIAFIHADVKVAAEGGRIDDAIGDQVVGRGVFICCLEGTAQSRPGEPTKALGTGEMAERQPSSSQFFFG